MLYMMHWTPRPHYVESIKTNNACMTGKQAVPSNNKSMGPLAAGVLLSSCCSFPPLHLSASPSTGALRCSCPAE